MVIHEISIYGTTLNRSQLIHTLEQPTQYNSCSSSTL